MGGVAYAAWYTSFPTVAIVIYFLRTRRGIRSLPVAINERYGALATLSFGLVRPCSCSNTYSLCHGELVAW